MFNFGKAEPDAPRTTSDTVGDAGGLLGDVSGIIENVGEIGKVSNPMVEAGGSVGFVGDFMAGASELSQGKYGAALGDLGASAAGLADVMSPEGEGPFGEIGGVAQMLGHGAEAARHTDEIDAGYQNNQFWTETGAATLGGVNALAASDPIASLYVHGGEALLDGAGMIAGAIGGNDYRFNAASVVGGAEHLAFDTGQAIGQGASSLWHSMTD